LTRFFMFFLPAAYSATGMPPRKIMDLT